MQQKLYFFNLKTSMNVVPVDLIIVTLMLSVGMFLAPILVIARLDILGMELHASVQYKSCKPGAYTPNMLCFPESYAI